MAENYKLPGSSYEEFVKIIKAYATGKVGVAMSLDTVAQTAGMDKTIVSRNNGFLLQLSLISEGSKKSPTKEGIDLGRAYNLKMDDEVAKLWRTLIENDEFLSRMLSAIKIRNGMEKTSFVNHILYSSGSNNNNSTRAGASTIIEIYKVAQLVEETDGKIIAKDESQIDTTANYPSVSVSDCEKSNAQTALTTVPVFPSSSNSTISINININVNADEVDLLSEKIKKLIESLNQ